MRNVNTILPNIDIERHMLATLTDVLMHTTPVRMYTYDTCIAGNSEEFYLKSDNKLCYDVMEMIVSDLYGKNRMDNKITLQFSYDVVDEDRTYHSTPIYVTYYDGSIIISNKVYFFNEDLTGFGSYRVVEFESIKF